MPNEHFFLAISWRKQGTFNEMMMMLNWIFILLTHWNNSLQVDMSLHSDTLLFLSSFSRC